MQFFFMKLVFFFYSGSELDFLIDFILELCKEVMVIFEQYNYGLIYMLLLFVEVGKDMLVNLGWGGLVNWLGGVFDFEFGVFYVLLVNYCVSIYLFGKLDLLCLNFDYVGQFGCGFVGLCGLLFFKLFYVYVIVIDFNIGEYFWEVLIGDGFIDYLVIVYFGFEFFGSFDCNFLFVMKSFFFLVSGVCVNDDGEWELNF